MIKAVLIDDEKNALEMLEWQLNTYCPQVHIAAMCQDAISGIEAIKKHNPNLVFLDIEMPVQNGFQVIAAFPQPNFDVVFTTAYNQFAIKAIKVTAFDYLLKPIDAEDLKATLSRYLQKKPQPNAEQLALLMRNLEPLIGSPKIALNTHDGMLFVPPKEIIRCESASNYTYIHLTHNRKYLQAKTLKEIEETLIHYQFFRIHHSHLINLHHVERYVRADGGAVFMSDGTQIVPSRNKKEAFIELFSRL